MTEPELYYGTVYARCPVVLGSNDFDPYDFTTAPDGGPGAPSATAYPEEMARTGNNRALTHPNLNTAMIMTAPQANGSRFIDSWWSRVAAWDGRFGDQTECCEWPSKYHVDHPLEIGATATLRNFPFCLRDVANRTRDPRGKCPGTTDTAQDTRAWLAQISHMVSRNETHGFHLTNWKKRKRVWAPMLHFVLNNTERRARVLSEGQRMCFDLARRWLAATHPLQL